MSRHHSEQLWEKHVFSPWKSQKVNFFLVSLSQWSDHAQTHGWTLSLLWLDISVRPHPTALCIKTSSFYIGLMLACQGCFVFAVLVCNGRVVGRINRSLGRIQFGQSLRTSSTRLVKKVGDVSEYFWGKIFRFTTSISRERERKITKTSLLNHERIELAQLVEQRTNK